VRQGVPKAAFEGFVLLAMIGAALIALRLIADLQDQGSKARVTREITQVASAMITAGRPELLPTLDNTLVRQSSVPAQVGAGNPRRARAVNRSSIAVKRRTSAALKSCMTISCHSSPAVLMATRMRLPSEVRS